MIVVAIIGILASIAIPNYQRYILRVRQTEAMTVIGIAKNAEFAHYALRDCFVNTEATPVGGSPGLTPQKWNSISTANTALPCSDLSARSFEDVSVRPSVPNVYYEYQCMARLASTGGIKDDFTCSAYGDIDGDGRMFEMVYGTDFDGDGSTIPSARGTVSGFPNDPVRVSPGIY
jgi:type IV pilus assembly protein PilA